LDLKEENVNNKHKKPWYIWLSLLAFLILWGDTGRRIKAREFNQDFDLWMSACGNFFKLSLFYTIVPFILFSVLVRILGEAFNDPIVSNITISLFLIALYFLGVFITYRHSVWREENIYHLLDKKTKIQDEVNNDCTQDNQNIKKI